MKNFVKKYVPAIAGVSSSVMLMAGNVMAEPAFIDLSGFEVDTTSVGTVGGIAIAGLGLMWGLRKIVKTINRT
jgi:hypothetical protein